jgi:hypothetical protein
MWRLNGARSGLLAGAEQLDHQGDGGGRRSGFLAAILLDHKDLDDAASRVVRRANELGGPDNITAVLVRVGGSP